jgi:hypothetical protein
MAKWHDGKTVIYVHNELHYVLSLTRDLYIEKFRRNIGLGTVIELLADGDSVITKLYETAKHATQRG